MLTVRLQGFLRYLSQRGKTPTPKPLNSRVTGYAWLIGEQGLSDKFVMIVKEFILYSEQLKQNRQVWQIPAEKALL